MKHFLITIITMVVLVGCGSAEERKAAYLEKARLSMEAGDLEKTRIELKNVLQIDPKDAQAHFQLGNIFEQQENYRKAFGSYAKAEELDPDNLEAHAKMGRFYLQLMGDIDTATEKMNLILGKDEANADGLLLKAGILVKQNDIDGAKKIAQDVFSRHPEHIDNAIFLATLYLREKGYEDSLEVLNVSIKEHPDNVVLKNMLANTYLIAGKYEQAENIYKDILKNNPELFSNYVKLAMFYQKNGNTKKAEELLRKAIKEDEEDLKRKMVLVEFVQQTKGNQGAIDMLKTFIANNPEMGDLRPALAKLYIDEKNLDDAEKVLNSAVSDFSEDSIGVKSRVQLAILHMFKGNTAVATSVIDDAIKISPNDSEVNFVKAKMQLQNQDNEGAIMSLRIVVQDDLENIEANILLASAHKANGEEEQASKVINRAYENNRTNAKGLLELARYHVRNKNKSDLGKVIDNYLSIDPDNYEALTYKSTLLNERKMFSEAKTHAFRTIELYPDMPNGYLQSVPYFLAERKKTEAITLLETGYDKVKENFRMLEILVSLYAGMKDFDTAENKVQSAIREKSETADLYMLLGKIQLSSKKTESAKISSLKAKEIKPDWNEPYLVLADIYVANKEERKAVEILKQGLTELQDDAKMLFRLAKIYESLSDFEAAIKVYEKAYKKYPNNAIVVNNLALLLSEHREDENSFKRAKELADKLKNVDQVVIRDTAGWVYYKTGNYAEAVNILKTVVEKAPDIAVFNYHFGMALYKTGNEIEAKTYLSKSLANNNNFRGKTDAEAQLQKLQ